MTAPCPSDYALEAYLLARGQAPSTVHIQQCEKCQARLARMEEERNEFNQSVYPATIDAVLARRGRRPWVWARPVLWLVPAAGLAASVLLIARNLQPQADYLGVKGGPVELSTFTNDTGTARALSDGATVASDAKLRFKFRTDRACWLWIISVDGSGEVSRVFPQAGTAGATVSGVLELAGGALLDGKSGPERLFAICGPRTLRFDEISQAARSTIPPGETSVRGQRAIGGLPPGTLQTTLLLEKSTPEQPMDKPAPNQR